MKTSNFISNEDAEIHYDKSGSGPLLVMIAGGGGDGARYASVAEALSDRYTVITYDRRCCGRSTGDRTQPFDAAQQARDLSAIIRNEGASAHVFGNSGGAVVALKLAENASGLVEKMIIHEPPALPLLEDGAKWIAETKKIEATYRDKGLMPAMMQFLSHMKGVKAPPAGPRPDPRNLEFFLSREIHNICRFEPDLEVISNSGIKLVACAGKASEDAYYARTSRVIAERTGCAYHEFQGHHFSAGDKPDQYAADIATAIGMV
ncbi:MAG: alpha/beta hydrolase [Rhizobiaceae bacterium]|nr:alpha/beta hydrolase [Rhizobiaceae bacterium]